MPNKSNADGYGRVAIVIHWLSVILILVMVISGFRAGQTIDLTAKAAILRLHAPVGVTILVLTLLRLLWWWKFDKRPSPVAGTPDLQHLAARTVHWLLYLVVLGMAGSGIGLFILSGAGPIVFGAEGPLPDFTKYTPRIAHGIGGRALIAIVLLHAGAALYHHFLKRDETLRRMWFSSK